MDKEELLKLLKFTQDCGYELNTDDPETIKQFNNSIIEWINKHDAQSKPEKLPFFISNDSKKEGTSKVEDTVFDPKLSYEMIVYGKEKKIRVNKKGKPLVIVPTTLTPKKQVYDVQDSEFQKAINNLHLLDDVPMDHLNSDDRKVYNAVYTLYLERRNSPSGAFMTPADIAKKAFETDRPTEKRLQMIKHSMSRLNSIQVGIDFREHLIKWKKTEGHEDLLKRVGTVEPIVQWITDIRQATNGKIVYGYSITRIPILSDYADAIDQMMTYTPKKEKLNEIKSSNTLDIEFYIRNFIGKIKVKKDGTISNNIRTFKNIYENCLTPEQKESKYSRVHKQRVRDKIENFLITLKKNGEIKDFTIEKKGRIYSKIIIIPNTN